MASTLEDARWLAAQASGGTSSGEIKELVLRLVAGIEPKARLLDFGAGKGELLGLLRGRPGIGTLAGSDLYERPEGLPEDVAWHRLDLNEPLTVAEPFDLVICSEVIEHLENPRATFRNLSALLKPGGTLVLTTPNQESIRSYVGLIFGGHFTHFLGASYPAHITALLRLDLVRIAQETGFGPCSFFYTDVGGVPKLPLLKWQRASFGLLKGRLFSDNVGMVTRKLG